MSVACGRWPPAAVVWLVALAAGSAVSIRAGDGLNGGSEFEQSVRPILLRHCAECHGEDGAELQLTLTTQSGVLGGSETGAVLVPGSSATSLLVQVLAPDATAHMPPDDQLSADEIAGIAAWVDGLDRDLPVGRVRLAAEDREHWAYQPLHRRAVPQVSQRDWPQTPIDSFILAQLEQAGLPPAAPADKSTLLRRLYFDLIGLPPSPEEIRAFEQDAADDAYERVVDELLASPRYGERWGRHWLDLARYADSSGFHNDLDRAGAWHYRDYVIAGFNEDKPYREFIREQLAGDLFDQPTLTSWIATGFGRTGPSNDDNMGMGVAREQYRLDELDGIISTTSNVFLGLTLGCARCHDHKYDPLSQRDYYRFLAYFQDAEKRQLEIEDFQPAAPTLHSGAAKNKSISGAPVLTSHGVKPRPTRLFWRGDIRNPGPEVQAGTPEVLAAASSASQAISGESSSRETASSGAGLSAAESEQPTNRLELADWLADPGNPLTWRVMANRIWMYHFGKGIVSTPSNFGRLGERPTHPELLDWLADELRRTGSVKSLHRRIVTSSVYRQTSESHAAGRQLDPDNRLYWRMPRRRLEAEPLRDAFLAMGGNLNLAMGGPGVKPRIRPDLLAASQRNKWPVVKAEGAEHWRRSVYVYVKRQLQLPLLELFDAPSTTHSCARREESLVPTQALLLMNDEFVREQAARFAARVVVESGDEAADQVRRAMWIALGRSPGEGRVAEGVMFIDAQTERLQGEGQSPEAARRAALADLCHVLMNLSEFVYVD